MEEILERENLKAAHDKVVENKGCPGIDGMQTKELYKALVAKGFNECFDYFVKNLDKINKRSEKP